MELRGGRMGLLRRGGRVLLLGFGVAVGVSVAAAIAYRFVPPPITPLMAGRALGGAGLTRAWKPLEAISPNLADAVIASEDARFCSHHGFDWQAIDAAAESNDEGGRLRGGSTISMQTAKNAFLWPARTWLRKGVEAGFTALIEALWPKRRILEVYLNIVEWGDGLYGAEAAAQAYFGKPAAALSRREAALMAVVLPDPRRLSPARPTRWVNDRASVIERRMEVVRRDGLDDCL